MYSHESLARLSHTQDQLAKYNSDNLSRLSAQDGLSRLTNGLSGGEGLGRLTGSESLSRLSQAQDSLARISNMTNSISPPQSSSHSSLSPGRGIVFPLTLFISLSQEQQIQSNFVKPHALFLQPELKMNLFILLILKKKNTRRNNC